jgi:hypothetical protein
LVAVALVGAAGLLTGADAPTGGERGVRAWVLSNVYLTNGGEGDTCSVADAGGLDRYYAMLSPADQAKLAGPANRQALENDMNKHFGFRRVVLRGARATAVKYPPGYDPKEDPTPAQAVAIGGLNGLPKGAGRLAFMNREVVYSACSNPYDFPVLARNFRSYSGKVAAGLDLDGKVGKEDFISPNGDRGVDNQLWRAVGCVRAFRDSSTVETARKTLLSARAPTLIELRGLDDPVNDSEVDVAVYGAVEALSKDGRGGVLARSTFSIDPNQRLTARTKGRIANGVLTTDPFDVVLNYKEQIIDAPRHIRGARVQATLKADGTIEGGIFGYYTLDSYYLSVEQMTMNGANLSGVSCPGVRLAIDKFADGYRDPQTGKYTAISSAYSFHGVPAFVVTQQPSASGEQIP